MRLVSLNGAEEVTHPTFGSATVGEDGVFDVPEDFGRALIAGSATWRDEAVHVAELARRERAELQDPGKAMDVLATLRTQVRELREQLAQSTDEATAARIGDLEAEVAGLREQLAAKPADGESDDGEADGEVEGDEAPADEEAAHEADGEPVKNAPAKKAAAKKATRSK